MNELEMRFSEVKARFAVVASVISYNLDNSFQIGFDFYFFVFAVLLKAIFSRLKPTNTVSIVDWIPINDLVQLFVRV